MAKGEWSVWPIVHQFKFQTIILLHEVTLTKLFSRIITDLIFLIFEIDVAILISLYFTSPKLSTIGGKIGWDTDLIDIFFNVFPTLSIFKLSFSHFPWTILVICKKKNNHNNDKNIKHKNRKKSNVSPGGLSVKTEERGL